MAHAINMQVKSKDGKVSKPFESVGRWGYLHEAQKRMAEIEAARPKIRTVIEGNRLIDTSRPTPEIAYTGKVAPIFSAYYG